MRILFVALILVSGVCAAQTPSTILQDLDTKRGEAHRQLREATVALRDARIKSCRVAPDHSCELAELSDVELKLLDLEWKYDRAARMARSAAEADRFKRLKSMAGEAKDQISTLADELNKTPK